MLERWKALAGDTSPGPWAPDHMAGFFQRFRPDGRGLPQAFEGVVGGDEILPRLLEVYRATADGWRGGGDYDGYFVVRNPGPTPASRAEDLIRRHLGRVAAMAEAVGDDELASLLGRPLRVEVAEGEAPWPPGEDAPESLIYEATGEFMGSLTPLESDALLMREGLYTIACDYNLQYHCLWPLYRHASTIEEPFGPYFDLWKQGFGYRFMSEADVRVYVPEGKLMP
jgi:hypothetical protein